MNILVSDCLLGTNCKWNGKNNKNEAVLNLNKKHKLFPVCPEVFGGLETPREPSEIVGTKVMSKSGNDVTKNFKAGALLALEMAKKNNCKVAILKAKSPSCGKGEIYDGSFSSAKTTGNGITTELLVQNGISVFTEIDLENGLIPNI